MFPNGEHGFLAQRTLDRNQVLPTASEVELLAYLLSAEQSLENTMGDSTLLVLQQEAIPLSSQPDVSRKQASFRDIAVKYATAPVILCGLASEGNLEKLKELVEASKSASVNVGDYDGRTPLHLAAEEGHIDVVKYLIEKGANVNVVDRWGSTPLRGAVSHLHPDVAEVLRDNGAHVKIGLKGKSLASGTSLVARAEVIEKMKADFNSLSLPGERDRVKVDVFKKMLKVRHGLTCSNHPLLKTQVEMITDEDGYITWDSYLKVLEREDDTVLKRAAEDKLVIRNWEQFCNEVIDIFESIRREFPTENGKNADYIPELAIVDTELFGLSLMTIDGQAMTYGDAKTDFPVQSAGKPLLYSIVSEELGSDYIHKFVGREPSGRRFNAFSLNDEKKPHNPLINAGAIMTASLFRQDLNLSRKFNELRKKASAIAGYKKIGFSQGVYLSERDTAYRNFALANYMKSQGGFPEGVDIMEATDFYLQITCDVLASCGATYANNGTSPITGEKVMSFDTVKNTLQIMYSCGMYDYSGEWACTIGLPGKSGVSGCIFIVIPNVMGLCIWSPPLDKIGNSYRGIEFCKRFASQFKWSIFDVLFRSDDK